MSFRFLAIWTCISLGCVTTVLAKPPNKQGLSKYYGSYLANSLNACTTCHVTREEAEDPEHYEIAPPHNPFGVTLRELGKELRAEGKPADIVTRLKAVADLDCDADGVPNELELLAGRSPGRASDVPTPDELARARAAREEFSRSRPAYIWDPFNPVVRPEVPPLPSGTPLHNPIDAFIAAARDAQGLKPRPEAAKHILLRRVYLDLIGLQPTPEQLRAFLDDDSADAYEKVVDHLLNSPQYGERWGRHWMDVWRYSDWAGWTGGNQIRDSQPHIWRWRDWIIESLNADKPYDQMVVEMLAGDELDPTNTDVLRATGYLVRNYKMLSRETWLQDTVKHTAQAFLGLTLDCARCHDHMYDPISQREYFQFRAVFEPHQVRMDRRPGEPDTKKDGLVRVYDADLETPTYLFIRGDDRNPDKSAPITPGVPSLLGPVPFQVEPVQLPLTAQVPEKLDFVVRETLVASEQTLARARDALEAMRQSSASSDPQLDTKPKFLALAEAEVAEAKHLALEATIRVEKFEDSGGREREPEEFAAQATAATALQRWAALLESKRNLLVSQMALENAQTTANKSKAAAENSSDQKLLEAAQKAAMELMNAQNKVADAEKALAKAKQEALLPPTTEYTTRPVKKYPATSTGRRLALARWVTDIRNPLTARVAMNHVWLRHFGQALVPSVFDFGQNGRVPLHPALLDWLAAEFMNPTQMLGPESTGDESPRARSAWSMKHIHRLILTSATYRMASTPDEAAIAADPDNLYYWRMNSRRLEAELVRDNVLWVAGELDKTLGGPDIDHHQGATVKRRSLYFRHAAEKQMEFMKIFDAAGVNECYERKESVVPQQALALANSELSLVQSRRLARALAAAMPDDHAFVAAAFERVLARSATPQELEVGTVFLENQARLLESHAEKLTVVAADLADCSKPAQNQAMRARENLVHALINHNDFVTIR